MRKTEKIRYEIDPHNRLVFAKTGKKSQVPKYRTVLDGKFKIDKNSSLIYHVKSPRDAKIPQQIKLTGNWSLDKDHNLVFTLNKWNKQYAGNKLTIKGELIDVKANRLSFAVATRDSLKRTRIYVLKLGGRWQADRYNRLSFQVTKERGLTDKLTLKGAWEVDKQNQVIYTYTKAHLKTKERSTKTITFKGYWNITERHRISYILSKRVDSRFDFRVRFSKLVKRGLQYEIGIGAIPARQTLTLFGKWKVNAGLGLLFEVPYEKGKIRRIVFGATGKLDKDYYLDFKLKNKSGKDLGIEIKLSRKILKDQGEAFIQALTASKELSLVAGMGFRW